MATPDCDYGVTVDLENGCGGLDSAAAVPSVHNRSSAVYPPAPSAVSFIFMYYFFFMFYMIGFSKTWWHAAVGIAVTLAFFWLSAYYLDFLDFATPRELSDHSMQCLRLMILVLYYVFFMFYLVGLSECWLHATLGIVLVTGFVLLSVMLRGKNKNEDAITPGREHNDVKPPDGDSSDLRRTLLGSRN